MIGVRAVTIVVVVVVVAACGGGSSTPEVDCAALLADPGNALATLTVNESDPAKIWAKLEQCHAPNGDTCERAALALAMAPSMARASDPASVADRARQSQAYAAQCRTLPADQQRCLLASYATTHQECGPVQEQFRREHPPS